MDNKRINRNYWLLGLLLGAIWCTLLISQTHLVKKAYSNQKDVFHMKLDEALDQTLSPIDTIVPEQLDAIITNGLKQSGISDECEIGLVSIETGKFVYLSEDADSMSIAEDGFMYNILCVSASGREELHRLYIYFPEIENRFHWNIVMSYLSVFLLALLLLLCFIRFFFGIRRQHLINKFRENMIHNMVHELKTPLTTIDLASQFLMDQSVEKDEAMKASYLRMISDESKSIQNLVEELLTVFSSDKLAEKDKNDVFVNKLLQTVANIHRLALDECHGVINFDLQAEKDVVYGDLTHISNAFSNLIDNAIKYRNGDLVLTISTKNVGNNIRIEFADNGMGIEKSNLPLIFEPFARFNTDNKHYVKGYGLGLDYVNNVVKYHKGTITVESELHKGSTFVVTLPLKTS